MPVLLGLGIIGYLGVMRWSGARMLRARGEPTGRAWRGIWHSPLMLAGVIAIVSYFDARAAASIALALFLVFAIFGVVLIIRGVRSFPAFLRRARRIGDPEAWKGN